MPCQKYTRDLFVGIHSNILPTPTLNFIEVKKCEIWPWFLTLVTFDALWFKNRGTYRKPNTSTSGDND